MRSRTGGAGVSSDRRSLDGSRNRLGDPAQSCERNRGHMVSRAPTMAIGCSNSSIYHDRIPDLEIWWRIDHTSNRARSLRLGFNSQTARFTSSPGRRTAEKPIDAGVDITVTGYIRPRSRVSMGRSRGICNHKQGIKASKPHTKGLGTALMHRYQVPDWTYRCFQDGYARKQGIMVGRGRTL